MSQRLAFLSVLGCTFVLIFSAPVQAQQPALRITPPAPVATNAPSTNAPSGAKPKEPVPPVILSAALVKEGMIKMNVGDADGALAKLNEAIRIFPSTNTAYVLRGSIYSQRKQWDLAEQDFKVAAQIDPTNVVLKLNVVEIKFLQKQYDAARAGYVALESNPEIGDLAKFKAFLCDLYGGHEALAAKELAAFNEAGTRASYYYANIAWDTYHKDIDGARDWLDSATGIFTPQKNAYYAQSLKDLGYLPLPPLPFLRK